MRQTILLIDDDRHITDALSMALESPGRTLVVCSDVESAELALRRFPVTDVVTDVQFSGMFGFEGLHFLERIRAHSTVGRIVLMTGYASDMLRAAATGYGATAVLSKPFEIDALERAINPPPLSAEPFELIRVASIEEILSQRMLRTVFQPIVTTDAGRGEPFAFEALARVDGGWAGGGPAELFEYAARRSRAVELNRASTMTAIEAAAALPSESLIFINVDPPTFGDPRLVEDVIGTAQRAGISLERLVLEITERSSFTEGDVSTETFSTLRERGVRFALDDHASAYSHLATISSIRPSFFKISQVFGTDFESDENKQRVVRNVVALAQDFGCATVLEGIESRATADAAAHLGIELAQGYFFSVPRDVSHWKGKAA